VGSFVGLGLGSFVGFGVGRGVGFRVLVGFAVVSSSSSSPSVSDPSSIISPPASAAAVSRPKSVDPAATELAPAANIQSGQLGPPEPVGLAVGCVVGGQSINSI